MKSAASASSGRLRASKTSSCTSRLFRAMEHDRASTRRFRSKWSVAPTVANARSASCDQAAGRRRERRHGLRTCPQHHRGPASPGSFDPLSSFCSSLPRGFSGLLPTRDSSALPKRASRASLHRLRRRPNSGAMVASTARRCAPTTKPSSSSAIVRTRKWMAIGTESLASNSSRVGRTPGRACTDLIAFSRQTNSE